jgi:hypothetical protein
MPSLQQVLESIKNSSPGAGLLSALNAQDEAQQKALQKRALEQRLQEEYAPLGNEFNKNLDIMNPKDFNFMANVARHRAMPNSFENKYSVPAKVEYGEEPGGVSTARIPLPGEQKEIRETITPEVLESRKKEAQAWFSPKEKQDDYARAKKAFEKELAMQDISFLDRARENKLTGYDDAAKARPFMNKQRYEEALKPIEARQHAANSGARYLGDTASTAHIKPKVVYAFGNNSFGKDEKTYLDATLSEYETALEKNAPKEEKSKDIDRVWSLIQNGIKKSVKDEQQQLKDLVEYGEKISEIKKRHGI